MFFFFLSLKFSSKLLFGTLIVFMGCVIEMLIREYLLSCCGHT